MAARRAGLVCGGGSRAAGSERCLDQHYEPREGEDKEAAAATTAGVAARGSSEVIARHFRSPVSRWGRLDPTRPPLPAAGLVAQREGASASPHHPRPLSSAPCSGGRQTRRDERRERLPQDPAGGWESELVSQEPFTGTCSSSSSVLRMTLFLFLNSQRSRVGVATAACVDADKLGLKVVFEEAINEAGLALT